MDSHSRQYLETPLGKAYQVPIQTYLDTLLPQLRPEINFEVLAKNILKGKRSKLPVTKNGRLWGYGSKKPSQIEGRKRITFKSLRTCAGKIAKVIKGLKRTLVFENNDESRWDLDRRPVDSLPDAYLRSSPDEPVDWTSIVIPGVYSKLDRKCDALGNIIKITRCMARCMYHDVQRRFVYAFTIEDSTMKLWYCDRAQMIVSEPFDFTTDWRILFRFLMSVMFAERHELGFDPTITLLPQDDGTTQYEIVVRSDSGEESLYRTQELLSEPGLDSLVGRGTRVWRAIKIADGKEIGEPIALKDAWVDDYRTREGYKNARIREATVKGFHQESLRKSLLTTLCHGDVFVADLQDCTRVVQKYEMHDVDVARRALENGEPSGICQVHYRIVHKEVGQPLERATSLSTIFKALLDVACGLVAIYMAGWVHGDISIGNILLFGDWAKIADLEYAVYKDERKEHDHIGTQYFMPTEVQRHRYLFKYVIGMDDPPSDSASGGAAPTTDVAREDNPSEVPDALDQRPIPVVNSATPEFCYNALHDLESLWWIAVYFIVTNEVVDEAEEQSASDARSQRQYAHDLFWGGDFRMISLQDPYYFQRRISSIHPSIRYIGDSLESMRSHLITVYHRAERNLETMGFENAHDAHRFFAQTLNGISKQLKEKDVMIRPLEML